MNVFGKNERSWRKARKRGVSPIIATILLVAITVVLAAVLYVLISGLTGGGVGSKPIGTAFTVGAPLLSGPAVAVTGCALNHYCYTVTVESSTVNFGNVLFEVKTSAGAIAVATVAGSFTVLGIAGGAAASATVAAASGMAMTASFATFGNFCGPTQTTACSSSSPLTNLYTIVVDLGVTAASPAGTGLTFVTLGNGGFTGTTSISLP